MAKAKERPQAPLFSRVATTASRLLGHQYTFVGAALIILVWGVSGPLFGFSDTWQLVINTSTTIVTFLAVFLIQNTQNRDSAAMQLKLDEVIRAVQGAHNSMLDLEELGESELDEVRNRYKKMAQEARDVAETATEVKQKKQRRTVARVAK